MLASNIQRDQQGRLCFAGQRIEKLAHEYGTPLYLMDEDRIRLNCRIYLNAFRESFGENALPLYASKAASFLQMYRIMAEEGMGVDTVSQGEIFTALRAGFPTEKITFHGDGKTDEDIRFAVENRVGCIVVDNETELECLEAEAKKQGVTQKVLLRITPGIDPHTYEAVNTGKIDVKFGVPIADDQALHFVEKAISMHALDVEGLHCHVGSMVFDEMVFEDTVDVMTAFMKELYDSFSFVTRKLNLGGGYGVRYREDDKMIDIPARIHTLAKHLKNRVEETGLTMPMVLMEPGRSIVADAGMTVYTVSTVKCLKNFKNYVIVDGGMADNPRYCLYRSAYTVLPEKASEESGEEVFDLVGRCCESGDILQPGVALPADISRGDLVAVCTTGAYNYSMASNYNRLGRPPVVMLEQGKSRIAVRRETLDDLCALDM